MITNLGNNCPSCHSHGANMMTGMMQMQMMMSLMNLMMDILTRGLMGSLMGHPGHMMTGGNPMFGNGQGSYGGAPSLGSTNSNFLGGSSSGGGSAPAVNGGSPIPTGPVAPGVGGMLDKARSMIGLHENRDTAAINTITKKSGINSATTPWCAAWAMNLLKDHGVLNLDGLTNRNYCPTIKKWAGEKGIWANPKQYSPKPGDAILFDYNKDGTVDHIGIVEKVENGKVITIEGNKSNSVKRDSYDLNSSSINGYVVTGTQRSRGRARVA